MLNDWQLFTDACSSQVDQHMVGGKRYQYKVFDCRMQMFLWNNIFFSLGFDVKDHYKDFGGDYAAYVAPVSSLYTEDRITSSHSNT